jgi:hypothetical protein
MEIMRKEKLFFHFWIFYAKECLFFKNKIQSTRSTKSATAFLKGTQMGKFLPKIFSL